MIGSVRRSQLITTYGVGAIVAVGDESVMVAGLDDWPVENPGEELFEPRLQIDGKRLRLPPGGESEFGREVPHIPVVRFPAWYYCANPECRRLDTYGRLSTNLENRCNQCQSSLIPSRFIAVCEQGHIEDFPYFQWVHHGHKSEEGKRHELRLQVRGTSGSLAGIVVECNCGIEPRSLQGAFDRDALVGIRSCGGRRPWLQDEGDGCGKRLRTTQRGASNVWFPKVRSVLSIPPWSEGLQQFVQMKWDGALGLDLEEETLRKVAEGLAAPAHVPYTVEEILAAVAERKAEIAAKRTEDQVRSEEYRALCQGRPGKAGSDFVAEVIEPPRVTAELIAQVTVVSRLREVRAFTGFTRLKPKVEASDGCAVARDADWVPAIAVHGEGIFLRLAGAELSRWERDPSVRERTAGLQRRWRNSYLSEGEPALTARFLLAHTLAHALIDEWSLAGGYPAASLRERIYGREDEVALLVYTAAADSAGSLGGLIAQADPDRLGASLVDAVRRYSWCSSDPVCAEAGPQGAEGLNLAACHACALLPETSCEHRNSLLDRALLVGTPENRRFGFFSGLIDA